MTIGTIHLKQEEAAKVYGVGHRVIYQDRWPGTIANIRVWHNGFFPRPVFDINFDEGGSIMNATLGEIRAEL